MTWTLKLDAFSELCSIFDEHGHLVCENVGKTHAQRIVEAVKLLGDCDLACNLAQGVQNDTALSALLKFDYRELQGRIRRAMYIGDKQ